MNCSIGFFPFASDSSLRKRFRKPTHARAIQVKGRGFGRTSEWRGFCHQDGSERGLAGRGFLSLQESGSKATRDESRRVVESEPATTAIEQRQGRQLELKMGPSGTV